MTSILEKAIVIKIINYDAFDQIITFLVPNGTISMIALGVRKITSKNRLALALGNVVSIEYFAARLTNKLSKLKKAHLIWQLDLIKSDNAVVLMEIINKIQNVNSDNLRSFYEAYLETINYWGKQFNHHLKVYILTRLLDVYGFSPHWNHCYVCKRYDRIIDFQFFQGGFSCTLHSKNQRPLAQLQAFQALGHSFEKYKEVEPKINFQIYQELKQFLQEQTF